MRETCGTASTTPSLEHGSGQGRGATDRQDRPSRAGGHAAAHPSAGLPPPRASLSTSSVDLEDNTGARLACQSLWTAVLRETSYQTTFGTSWYARLGSSRAGWSSVLG